MTHRTQAVQPSRYLHSSIPGGPLAQRPAAAMRGKKKTVSMRASLLMLAEALYALACACPVEPQAPSPAPAGRRRRAQPRARPSRPS